MARPQRNNVDYFPHPCKNGDRMAYIREKYGNDGYAAWYILLEKLGNADHHYIDLSEKTQLMLISSAIKVPETRFTEILSDLLTLNAFDSVLWDEFKIIYSQNFTDSIADAYSKRSNDPFTYEGLREHLKGLRGSKPHTNGINSPVNPQSKVKKTKVKNNIDPHHFEIAQHLKKRVLEIKQQKITESTLKNWAREVRLMISRDGRSLDEIKSLIDECHNMAPNHNGFTWRTNILSMQKLRQRWNEGKIWIGMTKIERMETDEDRRLRETEERRKKREAAEAAANN